jgi:hypothetical protein
MGTSPSGGRDSNSPTSTSMEDRVGLLYDVLFVMHYLIQKSK